MTEPDDRTPQQRFEESRVGRVVISGLVAVVMVVSIVWNLPESPISRSLHALVVPLAAATGLDQSWAVYSPPPTRVVSVEVDVKMANGETRIWTMQPGAPGVGWWSRWLVVRNSVIRDSAVRPMLAHWVVRQVTAPDEHAVDVSVVLRTENLTKPGDTAGGKSPAGKVLYQEALTVPR